MGSQKIESEKAFVEVRVRRSFRPSVRPSRTYRSTRESIMQFLKSREEDTMEREGDGD